MEAVESLQKKPKQTFKTSVSLLFTYGVANTLSRPENRLSASAVVFVQGLLSALVRKLQEPTTGQLDTSKLPEELAESANDLIENAKCVVVSVLWFFFFPIESSQGRTIRG